MSKRILSILLLLISGVCVYGFPATGEARELTLFTDRASCVSGDTVWFKVCLDPASREKGNAVRIQLDDIGNNLISSVVLKSSNGWAEGFIYVPDSLSTGQYFLTAFLNAMRSREALVIRSRSLLVYNRFEEQVLQMEIADADTSITEEMVLAGVKIVTEKEKYEKRDKVKVLLEADSNEGIRHMVIKAGMKDPIGKDVPGSYCFKMGSSGIPVPDLAEKDGFLISGKVTDDQEDPGKGVLILLSIPGEPPHFDYYLSGDSGDYHFFLNDAVGKTEVIVQAVSKTGAEFHLEQIQNHLVRKEDRGTSVKHLIPEQSEHISTVIQGSFLRKLFYPVLELKKDTFSMPLGFNTPFYGAGAKRIIPEEFFDLNDFAEISRELLYGVQYRNRNGNITIRMISEKYGGFFNSDPLRLINGIPVFKNSLFSNLNSGKIKYIDLVMKERVFGDLSFKGVLAVSLHDRSNSWISQQPNIFRFETNGFQTLNSPSPAATKKQVQNLPDLRQVCFWKVVDPDSDEEMVFPLSDLKGEVEITVEGVTMENRYFKVSKTINVK